MKKIEDYNKNLELLIDQYKSKDRFVGMLQAMNEQAQDIEDALFELKDSFYIQEAVGKQLDIIGEKVGIRRGTGDDNVYREEIYAKIAINNGSGEPEIIIFFCKFFFGTDYVELRNIGGGDLQIYLGTIIDEDGFKELLRIIPAGVGILILNYGTEQPFGFRGKDKISHRVWGWGTKEAVEQDNSGEFVSFFSTAN